MATPLERLLPEMRRGVLQIAVLTMLQEASYGYALCQRLAERGLPVEEGTLYPILRRFEEQDLVRSTWNTEGPRPRKYYKTTRTGASLLRQLSAEWEEIATSLAAILLESKGA